MPDVWNRTDHPCRKHSIFTTTGYKSGPSLCYRTPVYRAKSSSFSTPYIATAFSADHGRLIDYRSLPQRRASLASSTSKDCTRRLGVTGAEGFRLREDRLKVKGTRVPAPYVPWLMQCMYTPSPYLLVINAYHS